MQLQNLTAEWDLLPGRPTGAPTADRLLFSAACRRQRPSVQRRGRAGGAVQQVTRGDRQLGGFSASAHVERFAYTAADVQHPGEIFIAPDAGR